MSRHTTLSSLFTDIADALRDKFNLSGQLLVDDFDTTIAAIPEYNGEIYVPPLPIGGRIFYIDDTASGATYTFYDASGNILPTQTVVGLATATSYTVTGTPIKDRFYVYDNTSHTTGGIAVVDGLTGSQEMYWDENQRGEIGITSDGIGLGKTNTATALAFATDWGNYDIWGYIKNCNSDKLNGCNDWFIASETEQDKLKESGLVDWYTSKYIWSSVEAGGVYAQFWLYNISDWDHGKKFFGNYCFAARAF